MKDYIFKEIFLLVSILVIGASGGFMPNSFLTILDGTISMISFNRYDPRILVTNRITGVQLVCAINSSTIWLLMNVTGRNFQVVGQRKKYFNTDPQRSMLSTNMGMQFYSPNLTYLHSVSLNSYISSFSMTEVPDQYFRFSNNFINNEVFLEFGFISNSTIKVIYLNSSYFSVEAGYTTTKAFVTVQPAIPDGTILLQVFDQSNLTIIKKMIFFVSDITLYRSRMTEQLLAICDGTIIHLYNHSNNYQSLWNYTIPSFETLYDMQFSGSWLFFSTISGKVYQMSILGTIISILQTKFIYPLLRFIQLPGSCIIIIFEINKADIFLHPVDQNPGNYFCNMSSSVSIRFKTTASYLISNYTYNTSNTLNNTTTNITNTTINMTALFQSFLGTICLKVDDNEICYLFCNRKCELCNYDGSCLKCRFMYKINSEGECEAQLWLSNIITAIIIINTFRTGDFYRLYFVINELGFHFYHNVNYTGVVKGILDFSNIIQQNIWQLTPFSSTIQKILEPYEIPRYTAFTANQFLQIQRKESLFLQVAKDFYILFVPISLCLFLIMFSLYHLLNYYQLEIKTLFSAYSSFYGWILVAFVQNIDRLIFIVCHNYRHMFSLNFLLKSIQAITILFYGLIIILVLSFFYMQRIIIKLKLKNLCFNQRKNTWKPSIKIYCFIIRPILKIIFNVFFDKNYQIVILSVCVIEIISFFVLCAYHLLFRVFTKKIQFVEDCLLYLTLFFFNLVLYFNFYLYSDMGDNQLKELFEDSLYVIACIMMTILIFGLIQGLIEKFKEIYKIIGKNIKSWMKFKNNDPQKVEQKQKIIKEKKVIHIRFGQGQQDKKGIQKLDKKQKGLKSILKIKK